MGSDGIDFNIQQFLSEMRGEMHDGFNRIDATAAEVRADLRHHEIEDLKVAKETAIKLNELDRMRDSIKWAVRTIAAAAIVAAIGLLVAAWR